jgi:4-hydroxythreonine-4-phosphate dehydrogenase
VIRPPVLAVSLGDPGGIGPELTARALAEPAVLAACTPVVFGAPDLWARACETAKLPNSLVIVPSAAEARGPSLVACDATPLSELPFGRSTPAAGRAQFAYLRRAVDDLLAGHADALCTAPVNKAAIHAAGVKFSGHTEYLQERFGVPRVVMLMAGPRLRVALATTHLSIADVPKSLDSHEILETLTLVERELRARFGVAKPRLAVCGLNPHAGEAGRFGDEEARIIRPAIEAANRVGLAVEGPFPADGLFPRVLGLGYDAVLAMFHDQGLIPFKMLEFHDGVNVTLGLPKPRTSPDHGVAYDIAGSGRADPRSMLSALRLAIQLAGGQGA